MRNDPGKRNHGVTVPTEERNPHSFSVWSLRTIFKVVPSKPNQSTLSALKKSTNFGVLS